VGNGPIAQTLEPKAWQISVPIEGARKVLFSHRKINNVKWFAMCYRNGNKRTNVLADAWRLNAMRTMSGFVLSDQCNARKQLLAARTSKGKTYARFLQMLFDMLEMPSVLRGGETVVLTIFCPTSDRKRTNV
jgi:hypothetical protein